MAYDDRTNLVTKPLLDPGDPESGPAYDSITSSDSSFSRRDVSLSHVQPGQAIALPDGSVIPVGGGETTDNRSNMATGATAGQACGTYQQQGLPSKHGATPGPAPSQAYSQQGLPSKHGATPGPAPSQAYPQQGLPSKPGAVPGPAPSQAYPQQGLPSKHGATPGPAPGMTYPQQFPPGATPGPPPHAKGSEWSGPAPQYTGPYRYPHPMASNNQQPQYHPSSYNYNQQQRYRYPPPQPPYQQPYQARGPAQPRAPFPPTQYQPYQGPPPLTSYQGYPPVQVLGQGGAGPYYPYQDAITKQPKPRPPVKTSFKFDTRTLANNHFYIAICLLVIVIVCVNIHGIFCAISALICASIAANANAKDDYEQALKYQRKANCCNIGAGVAIVTSIVYYVGVIWITVVTTS